MRFFIIACVVCGLVASLGCMTNNWSSPIFKRKGPFEKSRLEKVETQKTESDKPSFWNAKFGSAAGLDPRAREIEKRLGAL